MDKSSFGVAISKTHRMIERSIENHVSKVIDRDLSPSQIRIIMYLAHNKKPIYQKNIETELGLKTSSISLAISDMEKNGYVIRNTSNSDCRYKEIILTKKAVLLSNHICKLVEGYFDDIFKDISNDELMMITQVFNKISTNIIKC